MSGPPPMGLANLQMRAQQGDPQAIQMLQELMGPGGNPGAGAGPGGPPPGQGGPPPGMVPPGQGQLSQQGGGAPIPPDVQARRAQQLIELLRSHQR